MCSSFKTQLLPFTNVKKGCSLHPFSLLRNANLYTPIFLCVNPFLTFYSTVKYTLNDVFLTDNVNDYNW